MKRTTQRFITVALVSTLSLGSASALAAQTTQPSQPSQPRQPSKGAEMQARGELLDVDTTAKTLDIKTAAGAEMTFKYTDSTQVSGSGQGVAGLATFTGQQVTIHFVSEGASNTATRIEVKSDSDRSAPKPDPNSDSKPNPDRK
ncbi:MAG: hypothetical protein AB7I50_23505 [Vicinamibacterales bacterium]